MEMAQVTIREQVGLGEPGEEGPVPLQQPHSVWGGCPERWDAETLGGELAAPSGQTDRTQPRAGTGLMGPGTLPGNRGDLSSPWFPQLLLVWDTEGAQNNLVAVWGS